MKLKQRGAVLILALLIVALVATLAVNFASQMLVVESRAEYRFVGAQQNMTGDSLVQAAIAVLKEDFTTGAKGIDHYKEDWALVGQIFAGQRWLDGSFVSIEISDAQSYLNLNELDEALKNSGNPNDPQRFSPAQQRFLRFLQTVDGSPSSPAPVPPQGQQPLVIDQNQAVAILEAIVDWIDADDNTSGYGGAEALQYQSEGVTWVPPNAPFESLDELKMVLHITPEIYEAIHPYLVALPKGSGLNINTLELQKHQPIIQSFNSPDSLIPLQAADIGSFDSWFPDDGYKTGDDFMATPDFQQLFAGGQPSSLGLSVNTNFFWVDLSVMLLDKEMNRRVLLERDSNGDIKILAQYSSGQATAIQALAAQTQLPDATGDDNEDDNENRPDAGDNDDQQKRR